MMAADLENFGDTYRQTEKESLLSLEDRMWNERARGCGGKNPRRRQMRRRKDGEETDRLAYFNSSDCRE